MTADCRDMADLLPDYLQRTAGAGAVRAVETHLRGCAECREDAELWTRLGAIPPEQPGPTLRARFDTMLDAYEEGTRTSRFPGWAAQIAAALVLVAGAFLLGRSSAKPDTAGEIAALHRELASTRQLAALSLLQHQSASDRLQGVSWTTRVGGPNREILDALLYTLRSDDSVDVRLAALDALCRYAGRSSVRDGVGDSLKHQSSPLMQIAVVDSLADFRDRNALPTLEAFRNDPNLLPAVRQKVEWSIAELNRG
jgi:hypothetical protein